MAHLDVLNFLSLLQVIFFQPFGSGVIALMRQCVNVLVLTRQPLTQQRNYAIIFCYFPESLRKALPINMR